MRQTAAAALTAVLVRAQSQQTAKDGVPNGEPVKETKLERAERLLNSSSAPLVVRLVSGLLNMCISDNNILLRLISCLDWHSSLSQCFKGTHRVNKN